MAAFLYKDFIAIRGRRIAGGLLAFTLFLGVAEACISDVEWLMLLYVLMSTVSICGMLAIPMGFVYLVAGTESTWKQKAWLHALPIPEKTYIAGKYWFVLILFYVMYSCSALWYLLVSVRLLPGSMPGQVDTLYALVQPVMLLCITVSALELPFALLFGRQRAELAKTGIAVCFGLMLVIWFFFGDISVLDRLGDWMLYIDKHPAVMMIIDFIFSVVALAAYYISYCITVCCYERNVGYGDE